jgi:predicted alpha/beta-fold hydrolase
MLETVRRHMPHARWHAVGVSLGGNAMLKCLGDNPDSTRWLTACAAVCVPLDLAACGNQLSTSRAVRALCAWYFLKPMKNKLMEKARRFPGTIDVLRLGRIGTLREFDDLYTAPMHGYKNALDYWTRAASKPALKSLGTPALVLNTRNDPFVPAPSLPGTHDCSDQVLLHQPAQGGHVGFTSGPFPGHTGWLPARLERYFKTGD